MHLEELEKLENEYNISLSEQDKLYMIVNEHTLVIHKDGTYTLIKGDKINESCSGFKYLGIHSTEGKKIVDLNDHSLKGENHLGSIYGVDDCNTLITHKSHDFIAHATIDGANNNFMYISAFDTTIPNITTVLENDSITQLLTKPGISGNEYIFIWPGLENQSKCYLNAKIRPHGDLSDHRSEDFLPSLNVNLSEGNLFGITKFILFRPITRRYESEIFGANLLRELNFLSPTAKVLLKNSAKTLG